MARVKKFVLLEVPVELAYQVVVDVERYPEFLPGCDAVTVLKKNPNGLDAEVSVSGGGMRQSFVTANTHDADAITMSLKRGPFQSLEGRWYFKQIGDHGCRVEVEVEFEAMGMLGTFLVPMADSIASKMVDAFVERINSLASA